MTEVSGFPVRGESHESGRGTVSGVAGLHWLGEQGQVAQLVEQRTENPRVGSSILPLAIAA